MSDKILSKAWPEWEIEKQLGRGSYGTVYQAVRKDYAESRTAIKIISIPPDASLTDSLRSEGIGDTGMKTYLQELVNTFVVEIQLMESLKGNPHIVSIDDYKVVEHTGDTGWDIYIRMELLTPLQTYLCDKKMSEEDVIRLGIELCAALEACEQKHILHRDIKPENIFLSDFGNFKLGDFGVARRLGQMNGSLSQQGTLNYMAPEIARGESYDGRADIYSLGIVLYRLLNQNRLPFLNTEKQLLSPNEREAALERRLRGDPLPPPRNASDAFSDVILCACDPDPNLRYSSASEMKRALARIAPAPAQVPASAAPSKSRKRLHLTQIIATFCVVLLIGTCAYIFPNLQDQGSQAEDTSPQISIPKRAEDGAGGSADPGASLVSAPNALSDNNSIEEPSNFNQAGGDNVLSSVPDASLSSQMPDSNSVEKPLGSGQTDSEKGLSHAPDASSPGQGSDSFSAPLPSPSNNQTYDDHPSLDEVPSPATGLPAEPDEPRISDISPEPVLSDGIRLTPGAGGTYSGFLYLRFPGESSGRGIYESSGEITSLLPDENAWFDTVTVTLTPGDDRITGGLVDICLEDGSGFSLAESFQDGLTFEVSAGTYQMIIRGTEMTEGPYIVAEDGTASYVRETFFVTVTFDHSGTYIIYPEN